MARRRIRAPRNSHPVRSLLSTERLVVLQRCRDEAPKAGWALDATGAIVGTLRCAACGWTGPAVLRVRLVATQRAGKTEYHVQTFGNWALPLAAPRCRACATPPPAVQSPAGGDNHA